MGQHAHGRAQRRQTPRHAEQQQQRQRRGHQLPHMPHARKCTRAHIKQSTGPSMLFGAGLAFTLRVHAPKEILHVPVRVVVEDGSNTVVLLTSSNILPPTKAKTRHHIHRFNNVNTSTAYSPREGRGLKSHLGNPKAGRHAVGQQLAPDVVVFRVGEHVRSIGSNYERCAQPGRGKPMSVPRIARWRGGDI